MTIKPTASLIVIGNEILSGRIEDANLNYIALGLTEIGVKLSEVRVIADVEEEIVKTVNELRDRFSYVFTTGGIGPTHDDITADAIAKAFKVDLVQNEIAAETIIKFCEGKNKEVTDAQLRMARIPVGADLIDNSITGAPGFQIENVFVMAGVPSIMRVMFDIVKDRLETGEPTKSLTLTTDLSEGKIAPGLEQIQNESPEVSIGSYPYIENERFFVNIVLESDNNNYLDEAGNKTQKLIEQLGGKVLK